MNRSRWLALIGVVGILMVAHLLRNYRLGAQNVWWDEALAIWAVRKPLLETTLWTAGDVHPPLYFWLLWPWVRLAGQTEFAARYLTVLPGVLAVAVAFSLGRRVALAQSPTGRNTVGVLAAGLVAIARFQVWWSQEMRMYMLAGLLGLLSLYCTLRLAPLEHPPSRPPLTRLLGTNNEHHAGRKASEQTRHRYLWLGYAFSATAALYTIYLAGLFLVATNAFSVLAAFRRRAWRWLGQWAVAQAVVLALIAPWLALAVGRMRNWSVVTEPASLAFVGQLWSVLVTMGISTHVERYLVPALVVLIVCLAGAILAWREGDGFPALLPGLFLVLTPLVVWAITQPRSLFYTPRVEARYLLPFAGPAYVLLAWSIVRLGGRWRPLGGVALVAVIALMVWALPGHYANRRLRDELQSLARTIRAYAAEGDAVLLVSGSRFPIFLYYYDDPLLGGRRAPVLRLPAEAERFSPDNVAAELTPLVGRYQRLWLAEVDARIEDPDGLARSWLEARWVPTLRQAYDHNLLTLYTPDGAPPTVPLDNLAPQTPMHFVIGEGATLLGFDLPAGELYPGDWVHLGLYLQAERPATVMVIWVDEKEWPVESRRLDIGEWGRILRREVSFQVFERTPAGRYRFKIEPADSSGSPVLLGNVWVRGTRPLPPVTPPLHPTSAIIADAIELRGYDLVARSGCALTAEGNLHITGQSCLLELALHWRPTHKLPERYTVFTHLIGPGYNPATNGPLWAGHDSEPLEGGYPTTQWLEGDTIVDVHRLELPPDAPPGTYELEVGMYRQPAVERLPVAGAGVDEAHRRILLTTLQVMH